MDRSFTVSWEDPAELGEQTYAMAGIEFLRALRDEELPPPPIQRLLGFGLAEVDVGRAVYVAEPGEQHYSGIGVVHSSLAAALLDTAMAAAVHSTLAEGDGYTALETKLNFIRPIFADTGPIRAEGRLLHRGRRVATSEADLRDRDGKLLAHATATCLVVTG